MKQVKGLVCFDCAGVVHVYPQFTEKDRDRVQSELDRNTMPRDARKYMPKKISSIEERFQCKDCGNMCGRGVRRVYGIGWEDNCFDCFAAWLDRKRLNAASERARI